MVDEGSECDVCIQAVGMKWRRRRRGRQGSGGARTSRSGQVGDGGFLDSMEERGQSRCSVVVWWRAACLRRKREREAESLAPGRGRSRSLSSS